MITYAIKNPAGVVVGLADSEEPPEIVGENSAVALAAPLSNFPEDKHVGGVWTCPVDALVWRDDRTIEETRASAIGQVDHVGDAARLRVVGDAARIEEYKQALASAQAFKDSGYTLDPVPEDVACWTTPTRTAQQSADGIIAKSVEWYGALGAIRSLRLRAKTAIDLAPTNPEVDALLATFTATLTAAMIGVQ